MTWCWSRAWLLLQLSLLSGQPAQGVEIARAACGQAHVCRCHSGVVLPRAAQTRHQTALGSSPCRHFLAVGPQSNHLPSRSSAVKRRMVSSSVKHSARAPWRKVFPPAFGVSAPAELVWLSISTNRLDGEFPSECSSFMELFLRVRCRSRGKGEHQIVRLLAACCGLCHLQGLSLPGVWGVCDPSRYNALT